MATLLEQIRANTEAIRAGKESLKTALESKGIVVSGDSFDDLTQDIEQLSTLDENTIKDNNTELAGNDFGNTLLTFPDEYFSVTNLGGLVSLSNSNYMYVFARYPHQLSKAYQFNLKTKERTYITNYFKFNNQTREIINNACLIGDYMYGITYVNVDGSYSAQIERRNIITGEGEILLTVADMFGEGVSPTGSNYYSVCYDGDDTIYIVYRTTHLVKYSIKNNSYEYLVNFNTNNYYNVNIVSQLVLYKNALYFCAHKNTTTKYNYILKLPLDTLIPQVVWQTSGTSVQKAYSLSIYGDYLYFHYNRQNTNYENDKPMHRLNLLDNSVINLIEIPTASNYDDMPATTTPYGIYFYYREKYNAVSKLYVYIPPDIPNYDIETQQTLLISDKMCNLAPENLKKGVKLLSVTGTLSPINNQDKVITPSTVQQTITADTNYTGIGTATVEAVTSEIDSNILPQNIKKNVSILGVVGALEEGGSGSGDVKQFATVEEMQENPGTEGDLAIVYSDSMAGIEATTEFQELTFPDIVVLPSAYTDEGWFMFRAVDPEVWTSADAQLSPTYFRFNCFGGEASVQVTYTSTDGITYTRTDSTGNPVDLGTVVKADYEWDDILGYFMQIQNVSFRGLYVFKTNSWELADSQFKLEHSDQLLTGITAYGKTGIVTGDGSIWQHLPDTGVRDLLGINQTNYSKETLPVCLENKITIPSGGVVKYYNKGVASDETTISVSEIKNPIANPSVNTTYSFAFTFFNNRNCIFDEDEAYEMLKSVEGTATLLKVNLHTDTSEVISLNLPRFDYCAYDLTTDYIYLTTSFTNTGGINLYKINRTTFEITSLYSSTTYKGVTHVLYNNTRNVLIMITNTTANNYITILEHNLNNNSTTVTKSMTVAGGSALLSDDRKYFVVGQSGDWKTAILYKCDTGTSVNCNLGSVANYYVPAVVSGNNMYLGYGGSQPFYKFTVNLTTGAFSKTSLSQKPTGRRLKYGSKYFILGHNYAPKRLYTDEILNNTENIIMNRFNTITQFKIPMGIVKASDDNIIDISYGDDYVILKKITDKESDVLGVVYEKHYYLHDAENNNGDNQLSVYIGKSEVSNNTTIVHPDVITNKLQ